jgi:site-specific recombinase XerC
MGIPRRLRVAEPALQLVALATRRSSASASFATNAPRAGSRERDLELHEVRLLLGHARITTTQRYLHASVPTLGDKFRRFG